MFNEKLFRMTLLREGISLQQISELLGINLVTLYRKMKGNSDFYRDEVQQICDYLHLDLKEKEDIFFDLKITETQKRKVISNGNKWQKN